MQINDEPDERKQSQPIDIEKQKLNELHSFIRLMFTTN